MKRVDYSLQQNQFKTYITRMTKPLLFLRGNLIMKSLIQTVLMILGILLLIPLVFGVGVYIFCRLIIFFLPLICLFALGCVVYMVFRLVIMVRK